MQHQLLHHINSSFQTNALKPALAGMNPKSFPVASPGNASSLTKDL
jgi:hypothetical protein